MHPDQADALLADLVEQMLADARSGMRVDLEALIREHPEQAAEIRELWGTIQVAEYLAESAASNSGYDAGYDADYDSFTDVGGQGRIVPVRELPRTFGDYDLLEEVGRGGMGVVFRARQRSLNRIVALKVVLSGEFASRREIERFRAEAEFAASIHHPNIVQVFEVGEIDDQPFFTMQFIDGTTLARKLLDGPLPPGEAARLLKPVCEAVAAAHARGLIHRDLKPSNILIDRNGVPLITDFGLAKSVATSDSANAPPSPDQPPPQSRNLTRTGDRVGTPNYMAPEQVAGRRGVVSPASDVYSLGAILYQCLVGRPPFQAASDVDTLLMVLDQEPPAPRLINPRVDVDLEMVALKCLQKPPELRYASAGALAQDLAAYLANEPVSARSTSIVELLSRMFRETHHAVVLENWGLLWMLHSLVLLVLCIVTNLFQFGSVTSRWPYLALWVIGLGTWAGVFWMLRRRSGPITFIERQIAHVWGASMVASSLLFAVETLLGMPVLTLSPVLPLCAAMVFLIKGGMLSGTFYFQAAALFASAIVMAWIRHEQYPDFGLTFYGVVSALCFFIPGLKYFLQRGRDRERSLAQVT
jgi:serine/threonine-protein kinase